MYPSRGRGTENGGEMTALSKDGGPAFGAHAFIWGGELSESDRGTPGTANVHWDEVFHGLGDIDYGGALAMESFAAVHEAHIGATALWRLMVGDPDALVRDGLVFLRARGKEH